MIYDQTLITVINRWCQSYIMCDSDRQNSSDICQSFFVIVSKRLSWKLAQKLPVPSEAANDQTEYHRSCISQQVYDITMGRVWTHNNNFLCWVEYKFYHVCTALSRYLCIKSVDNVSQDKQEVYASWKVSKLSCCGHLISSFPFTRWTNWWNNRLNCGWLLVPVGSAFHAPCQIQSNLVTVIVRFM